MSYTTFDLTPVTPTIGAEVQGLDLTVPLTTQALDELQTAWQKHLVLFFRNQAFTLDQLRAFGQQLGEPHIHPAAAGVEGYPELLAIHTDSSSKSYPGRLWHSDVSCDKKPPLGSILHLHQLPPSGGDTLFANMYAVYEALSEPMKQFLDPLTAIHSSQHSYQGYHQLSGHAGRENPYPEARHPVVRTHPDTGQKALFVNQNFTKRILELEEDEGQAILKFLFELIKESRFHCRFRWQPHSVAIWDNRCTQHLAMWDYYPHTRSGHRYTIAGDRPY